MGQSLSKVIIHVVFSTKNRMPLIDSHIEKELYAFLGSYIKKMDTYIYAIGGIEDHIHLGLGLGRNQPICKLIEELKKNSSRWIKKKHPRYYSFEWQTGYGVFSISHSHLELLENYINSQKEHHKTSNCS